jgi:hypothetical protein
MAGGLRRPSPAHHAPQPRSSFIGSVAPEKTVHIRYTHHVCSISQNYAKLLIRNYF